MNDPCWEHATWEVQPVQWLDGKLLLGVKKNSLGIEFNADGQPCRLMTGVDGAHLYVQTPVKNCKAAKHQNLCPCGKC